MFRRCGHGACIHFAFLSRRRPYPLRLPDPQEPRQRCHRTDRSHHIHQPWPVEIGDQILRNGEGHARHQQRRPDFQHALAPGKGPDQPERHEDGEERELTPDHPRQLHQVYPRHRRKRDDRRSKRAIGDRRGVGDERKPCCGQGRKTQSHQHRGSHSDRRAETRGTFKKAPNEKAIKRSWRRRSGVMPAMESRRMLNWPVCSVSR